MTTDPQLEQVREFHKAFNCAMFEEPTLLELSGADKSLIRNIGQRLALDATILKEQCAEVNGLGRIALGLYLVRLQLAVEEVGELATAIADSDMVAILDALSDIGYVNTGTYLTFGLGDCKVAADAEVHRSNMSKLDKDGKPIIGVSGRVIKPQGWTGPDLEKVLALSPVQD